MQSAPVNAAMPKKKTALIPLILSALSAILSFGFTFLVAKPLGPEMYGQIEYYIGIISVCSAFLAFGLPNYLSKETQFKENKKAFFTNIIILFSILSAVGIPIFLLIGYFFLSGLKQNLSLISLIYLASIFTSLGTLIASFYIGLKEPSKSIFFSTIIPHSFVLIISLILLYTNKSELPNYYLYISLLAHIVAVTPCLVKYVRKSRFTMKKSDFRLIVIFYVIALTSSLYSEASKILQREMNESFATVGILGVSIKIISVVAIFLGAISKITMPEFAMYAKERDFEPLIVYYRKVTRINSYVVIPFLIALALQSTKVLGLFGSEYTLYPWIFLLLIAASFVTHVTGPTGTLLLMSGFEKYEVLNGCIKLVLYLAIGIPVGLHYIWGLPFAIFIADGVINIIKFVEVKHVTGYHPYTWKMALHMFVLMVISFLAFFGLRYIANTYIWLMANVVVGATLILAFFIFSPYKDDKRFIFAKKN